MGNCYIFNPAGDPVLVTLNNQDMGPIAGASLKQNYAPRSMLVSTGRYADPGTISIFEPNVMRFYYPDDPVSPGPFSIQFSLPDSVSVNDRLILYTGRQSQSGANHGTVVVMNIRGFVLVAQCALVGSPHKAGGHEAA